jgi:hypothetical protein
LTDPKKYLWCFAVALALCAEVRSQSGIADSVAPPPAAGTGEPMDHDNDNGEFEEQNAQGNYNSSPLKQHSFDKESWKKATRDLDYNETPEQPKKEEKQKKQDYTPPPPEDNKPWFESSAAQTALIIVAVAALDFILFKLMSGRVSNTKVKPQQGAYSIEQVEETLHESDLEKFLLDAIQKKEYRLAIRIYYLMVIKSLSERDWITWKKDKTNNQYLSEMSARPDFALFRDLTRLFEYCWYGELTIDEQRFHLLRPRFDEFLTRLKSTPAQ